jgi:hypothetical protein
VESTSNVAVQVNVRVKVQVIVKVMTDGSAGLSSSSYRRPDLTAESLFRQIGREHIVAGPSQVQGRQKIASVIGPCVFPKRWIDPVVWPAARLAAMRPGKPDATRRAVGAPLRRRWRRG